MLIIAFGLMLIVLLVFLLWNLVMKCRAFWHARKLRNNRRRG